MNIHLHPGMTARQISEWCAANGCYIEISYMYDVDGKVQCLMLPHKEKCPAAAPLANVVPLFPTTARSS